MLVYIVALNTIIITFAVINEFVVIMQRFWFGFARHFDTNNDTFIDKNEFFAMLDTLDINLSEDEKNEMVLFIGKSTPVENMY